MIIDLLVQELKHQDKGGRDIEKIFYLLMSIEGVKKYFLEGGMDKATIKLAAQHMKHGFYRKGETIFLQGDPSDTYFCIINGAVSLTYQKKNSDKLVILSTLMSGEGFGERGIINMRPRATSAIAAEDTHVFILEKKQFKVTICKSVLKMEQNRKDFIQRCFKLDSNDVSIREFYNKCIFKTYKKGSVVYSEEDESDCIYAIYKGGCIMKKRVRLTWNTNKNVEIKQLESGALFGGDFAFNRKKCSSTVFVKDNYSIIAAVRKADIVSLDVGQSLLHYISELLRPSENQIEDRVTAYKEVYENTKPMYIDDKRYEQIPTEGNQKSLNEMKNRMVIYMLNKQLSKNVKKKVEHKNDFKDIISKSQICLTKDEYSKIRNQKLSIRTDAMLPVVNKLFTSQNVKSQTSATFIKYCNTDQFCQSNSKTDIWVSQDQSKSNIALTRPSSVAITRKPKKISKATFITLNQDRVQSAVSCNNQTEKKKPISLYTKDFCIGSKNMQSIVIEFTRASKNLKPRVLSASKFIPKDRMIKETNYCSGKISVPLISLIKTDKYL